MNGFVEPARRVPVSYEVDVAVAGGGATGVAAAIGAARAGLRVMLIENYGFCGGMATAGMSGTICGLFTSAKSGKIRQLVYGFADEFYRGLQRRGGVSDPFPFGDTALVVHDPQVWKEVADDMLAEAGVMILYHSRVVGVVREGRTVQGVLVENKNGRHAIMAKRVVDATGDGDVCMWAGAPYSFGKNGAVQYATMVFRMNHVDVAKALGHGRHRLGAWIDEAERAGYDLPRKHIYLLPSPRPGEVMCNVTRITKANGEPIDATKAEDLTIGEQRGRKQVREYERFLRRYVPGFESAMLNDVAPQLGIRQSRTIAGEATLTNDDVFQARKSAHAVASSAWCIEAHGRDGIFMFYLDNDYYDIPYETLIPREVENVIAAGRTLSAEHEALASARVTAQCFLTGYAAGVASGLSLRHHVGYDRVDAAELKELLHVFR
ncbi:MAG: FAD-dependent oxidoreductase [Paenibacillaceae bacterium]|nr:FAD-dependent oxidoreductase [Paenibacillaceae bacterium]